jgi:hypothetical protein
MSRKSRKPDDWFPPKRYGYGAGPPLTWQGWVLIAAFALVILAAGLWARRGDAAARWGAIGTIVLATAVFVPVIRRHTRGGWRWRWGKRD